MRIFVAHSLRDREFVDVLFDTLVRHDHQPIDTVSLRPNNLISDLSTAIHSADAVIGVISEVRPNVLFEIGFAVGAARPILIVARPPSSVPGDLAEFPLVEATMGDRLDAEEVVKRLARLPEAPSSRTADLGSVEDALRSLAQEQSLLQSVDSVEFEHLISDWLRTLGFTVRETADESYDLTITSPEKGSAIVEVKKMHPQTLVSVEAVRKVLSSLQASDAGAGIVVSSSGFTPAAMEFSRGTALRLLTLSDLMRMRTRDELLGEAQPSV